MPSYLQLHHNSINSRANANRTESNRIATNYISPTGTCAFCIQFLAAIRAKPQTNTEEWNKKTDTFAHRFRCHSMNTRGSSESVECRTTNGIRGFGFYSVKPSIVVRTCGAKKSNVHYTVYLQWVPQDSKPNDR